MFSDKVAWLRPTIAKSTSAYPPTTSTSFTSLIDITVSLYSLFVHFRGNEFISIFCMQAVVDNVNACSWYPVSIIIILVPLKQTFDRHVGLKAMTILRMFLRHILTMHFNIDLTKLNTVLPFKSLWPEVDQDSFGFLIDTSGSGRTMRNEHKFKS